MLCLPSVSTAPVFCQISGAPRRSRKLCSGFLKNVQEESSSRDPVRVSGAIRVSSGACPVRVAEGACPVRSSRPIRASPGACPVRVSLGALPIRAFEVRVSTGGPPIRVSTRTCPITVYAEAMSFWTCASCTFVNQESSKKCEACEQTRKPTASSSSRAVTSSSLLSSQQENTSKWGCRACTFLNKDSDNLCDICGTPKSSISLDTFAEIDSALDEEGEGKRAKFWPLRSCTVSHPDLRDRSCSSESLKETSSVPASTSTMASKKRKKQQDSEAMVSMESDHGSSCAVSNNVLGKLHLERVERKKQSEADINQESPTLLDMPLVRSLASNSSSVGDDNQSVIILTYNVWFREDLEVVARMNAIGDIISEHNPHFICFQEVTPAIYNLFQCSPWWGRYQCSVTPALASKRAYFCLLLSRMSSTAFHRKSYQNTVMGRELCIAKVDVMGGKQLFVATTHLESPCPAAPTWDQMFSPERVSQAKEALNALKGHPNVVFGGDMNWDDKLDGSPPIPGGWCDAWLTLRPREEGLTYDSKENAMLSGSRLRKRLDRLFCHLQDFRLESIERVGTKPIPGVMFEKEVKVKKQAQMVKLPVLPSDHFGLLLKISQSG